MAQLKISMMALLAAIALAACGRETPSTERRPAANGTPAAAVQPQDFGGKKIDVTMPLMPGAVGRCQPSATLFTQGEPIRLLFELNEIPDGLHVAARVLDSNGEPVAYTNIPATHQKPLTVSIKEKLKRGKYRLEGYWGGNLVCEHDIEVK